ncbi:hypothetical protein DEV91_104260 [Phyllobacterium brassicacearum]|nr:hypothetical protein DEV91_104260 [Phyllobacterium brassicacearum]
MINRALNQKTGRHLGYEVFLDLASDIGCVGAESRNDLGRPLFDSASVRVNAPYAEDKEYRDRCRDHREESSHQP